MKKKTRWDQSNARRKKKIEKYIVTLNKPQNVRRDEFSSSYIETGFFFLTQVTEWGPDSTIRWGRIEALGSVPPLSS